MDHGGYDDRAPISHAFNKQAQTVETPKQRKTTKFILSKYTIYETKERMYIVGSNKRETMFRILEIELGVPRDKLNVLFFFCYFFPLFFLK